MPTGSPSRVLNLWDRRSVAGLVAALSVTHLLARFLYGVSTMDAYTFAWTPVALFVVGALACFLPALRATRVDPIKALKQE